jgi:hypothetical protein
MEIPAETFSRFATQHKIIKYYIDGLPPEAIYKRLGPDKWSIHEIIAYMCRYQYVFFNRIKEITSEVNPFFETYKPEEDVEFSFTAAKTTGSLLHEIYRIRQDIITVIENLADNQCLRFGTHAILGKMNLCQWVEFFLLHESNQLFKIFKTAGSFWAFGINEDNIISLPRMQTQMDELAG